MLDKSLQDSLRRIAKLQDLQFRQAKIILADFIATDERKIDYMDQYMDTLLDFMEPESETEMLMRKYYDHIATFNPEEAKLRLDRLEDDLGYKTKIVYSAGILAEELHSCRKDKGGNDYFKSHLLKVASSGYGWKEKVVGFLHDSAEDTPNSTEDIITALDKKTAEILSEAESIWWLPWMEDIDPYPAETTHMLTEEEKQEMKTALNLLNKNNCVSRKEYIDRIAGNRLAMKVKLNDLKSNMDISRIPNPTARDFKRLERYQKEYSQLLNALS